MAKPAKKFDRTNTDPRTGKPIAQQKKPNRATPVDDVTKAKPQSKIYVPGSPKPPKEKEGDYLGEKGRGIIQTLKNRTAIEENKQERKAKKK